LLQKPNVRPLKGPDQKDFPTKGTLNEKVISLAVLHKFDALNRNLHVLPLPLVLPVVTKLCTVTK
jgi:hypothetical protein